MRIINIMLAKARGGVEAMAVHYHHALTEEGFEVLSIGHPGGLLAEGLLASQITPGAFAPLQARFNLDPLASLRLRRYSRAFRPDMVLAHGNRAAGLCLSPLAGLGGKTVQVMHNAFDKAHLRHMKAAICVSQNVLQHVRQRYPDTPACLVSNFSPLDSLPVKPAPTGVPVIGALGRLHEQKGFDVLLKAAAILCDEGVAFSLRIAGEGPEGEALAAQCHNLNLEAFVTFCGWQSPVLPFLGELDLFVVPSRYEPFGLVVVEAMAAGVPVAASDLEGPREILDGGTYGRLFPGGNPQALAHALRDVITHWPETTDMAQKAQARALGQYGFAAGRARLRQAIVSIAAQADAL
ncbi:glycosyltransferase [Asticcacaulis sp. EMRT-3]|uniref:glycosyltransferase n=1 Tax=Asticcacaulis sp. EMRT-3 TaxID=3040349 RepID=UPI0024AF72FA|nr:glycosyltransferase [Asticcacaulis sp. EMRT-3]MDI7776273.1 glycosyltransferase [Asticcacaulis sp. EMRT-3]